MPWRPNGWNSLLASQKILELGSALPLILEWRPADFGSVDAFEVCLLLGIGLALFRGVKLPPLRIVLLLGMLRMALSWRNSGAARPAGETDRAAPNSTAKNSLSSTTPPAD